MSGAVVDQEGNGVIEMLLFTPVALFFLFVVVDAGVALFERGSTADALRTGLSEEGLIVESSDAISLGLDGGINIDKTALSGFLQRIADRIEGNLLSRRPGLADREQPPYEVEVSLIRFPVDAAEGGLDPGRSSEVVASVSLPAAGVGRVRSLVPSYPFVSREDFIASEIAADPVPSRFAQPLGYQYAGPAGADSRQLFLENAFALFVEVRSIAPGINREFTKAVLGKLYVIQLQQLQSLRAQFR